jgi:CrcB protein
MTWVYVGLGGALGALLRFAAQSLMDRLMPGYPWGTELVNAAGGLVIGLLFPLLGQLPEATRPFVVVGVLGALTTMSSFSLEVVSLVDQGRFGAALGHWAGGALLCVGLCAAGYKIATSLS